MKKQIVFTESTDGTILPARTESGALKALAKFQAQTGRRHARLESYLVYSRRRGFTHISDYYNAGESVEKY